MSAGVQEDVDLSENSTQRASETSTACDGRLLWVLSLGRASYQSEPGSCEEGASSPCCP